MHLRRFVSVPSTLGTPYGSSHRRHAGFTALIRKYGAPLALYYLCFNETCVVALTYLLHTEAIGAGDIVSVLEYIGLESYVDVRGFSEASTTIAGFPVSGRLVMNFGIATGFMSLWTPVQLPFCIATLPIIMRWFRRPPRVAPVVHHASPVVASSAAPPVPPVNNGG